MIRTAAVLLLTLSTLSMLAVHKTKAAEAPVTTSVPTPVCPSQVCPVQPVQPSGQ